MGCGDPERLPFQYSMTIRSIVITVSSICLQVRMNRKKTTQRGGGVGDI